MLGGGGAQDFIAVPQAIIQIGVEGDPSLIFNELKVLIIFSKTGDKLRLGMGLPLPGAAGLWPGILACIRACEVG